MSSINLFNSKSKKKEVFQPINPPQVTMYNCGPTVYQYPHIGNLRSFIFADTLRRTLEMNNYNVKQVINITDVGHLTEDSDEGQDKIEIEAKKEKKAAQEIVELYTNAFFSDLEKLNVKTKDVKFPKASEHIPEQIELIKELEEKGFAYKISDGIYFNTSKLSKYDVFQTAGDMLHDGARVTINSEKHSVADFALWKFSGLKEKRQQEWDSPWGIGFPGWHLECSAMAMKYLGETIDIHTGGADHKFPHHPNEIAQSESSTGVEFARFWLHNGFLNVSNKKMAKSKGNFLTLNDLEKKGFQPLDLRYLLLTSHYRSPMSFTLRALEGASSALNKLKEYIQNISKESDDVEPDKIFLDKFHDFINDDLNTPQAIALVWLLVKNKRIKRSVKLKTIEYFDTILGLELLKPSELKIPKKVQKLLDEREKARAEKNWEKADQIREEMENNGFTVRDEVDGAKITPISQRTQ